MPSLPASQIREIAAAAGFDIVRFGPADVGEDGRRFMEWLAAGRAGAMDYLERNQGPIADPTTYLPGARSTIAVAWDYGREPFHLEGGGQIARYAVGRDYHRALGNKLRRLRNNLEQAGMPRGSLRGGTDAVPVLERALAVRAGIGFLAKSAMTIAPDRGPYLLLGELLTTAELPTDDPAPGTCGTCRACIDACPTGAITAPFEVDARRCLSYTTIELRGDIPRELRAAQQDRLFGCDDCLEVCPFTRHSSSLHTSPFSREPDLQPHQALERYSLHGVLGLDQIEWDEDWTGTAMRRATRSGLRRNAAVVLGNLRDESARGALRTALHDPDQVVRGHAAWGLGRLDPADSALGHAHEQESDPWVRAELEHAMSGGAAADGSPDGSPDGAGSPDTQL